MKTDLSRRMLAMLEQLEFAGFDGDYDRTLLNVCPICEQYESHAADCDLATLLAEARAELGTVME